MWRKLKIERPIGLKKIENLLVALSTARELPAKYWISSWFAKTSMRRMLDAWFTLD